MSGNSICFIDLRGMDAPDQSSNTSLKSCFSFCILASGHTQYIISSSHLLTNHWSVRLNSPPFPSHTHTTLPFSSPSPALTSPYLPSNFPPNSSSTFTFSFSIYFITASLFLPPPSHHSLGEVIGLRPRFLT